MNVKTKYDFYSGKEYKINLLDSLKGISPEKDEKIEVFKKDLEHGFTLYTRRNLERFLQCHDDIEDYAEQFVKLNNYYENNNKYANTQELYQILYGDELGLMKWREKSDRIKGTKNPAFDHGGRLSPWKEGSINYSKESKDKAIKNRTYNTRVDYYLNKGHTQEEAESLLKERQATGRLDKFIKRYGEEQGKIKWKERQVKWQNTLKSKSLEEQLEINKRKSSGIGRYLDRDIPGKLYYIHFYSSDCEFWKIGITSKDIEERFNFRVLKEKSNIQHEILFLNEYETIQQAYYEEQFILSTFEKNRMVMDIDGFYTTEAFDKDVLKGFYNEII